MKRFWRVATHPVAFALVAGALLLVGGPLLHRALAERPLPDLGALPDFQLTDEAGRPFGLAQLRGHPTVVDFVFTSCPSICPKLTAAVAGLEQRTTDLPLHFLSISVDPEHDTPPVLTAYAKRFHADPSRWAFVTGDPAKIRDTVVRGFKVELEKTGSADDPNGIVHDGHLVLVDGAGRIRGYYGSDAEGLARLVEDARRLSGGAS